MTYFVSKDETEKRHRTAAEIHSAKMMPPMINNAALEHYAECSECYFKLNEDAKHRVRKFSTEKTKRELTQVNQLMAEAT